MAKEDDLDLDMDGAASPAPGSRSKMLFISLAVVLLLGISTAATLMLSGVLSDEPAAAADQEAEAGAKADSKDSKKAGRAPLNYVPLDPPFVVNFGGDFDVRFLQVTVEVGTREAAVVERVKEHLPAIRNSLVLLFSSQDPQALNSREGKEKLRDETLAEVQKVLKQETGVAGVESVFFTSFVMQ